MVRGNTFLPEGVPKPVSDPGVWPAAEGELNFLTAPGEVPPPPPAAPPAPAAAAAMPLSWCSLSWSSDFLVTCPRT